MIWIVLESSELNAAGHFWKSYLFICFRLRDAFFISDVVDCKIFTVGTMFSILHSIPKQNPSQKQLVKSTRH